MKKNKLLLVSLMALTLSGCNGESYHPYEFCYFDIKKQMDDCELFYTYQELNGSDETGLTDKNTRVFSYIITTYNEDEKLGRSEWCCFVEFDLGGWFERGFQNSTGKTRYSYDEVVMIDCDLIYTTEIDICI